MKKTLKPILHRDAYTIAIEQLVRGYFTEVIFDPIEDLMRDAGLSQNRTNAIPSSVKTALDTGRIWYADGKFTGKFSALISRELREIGATFDPVDGSFTIAEAKLGIDLRAAVTQSVFRAETLHKAILATLVQMETNVPQAPTGITTTPAVNKIVADLGEQFDATVEPTIEIPMEIPPGMREELDRDLVNNLDLYVKGWTQETIVRLRAEVQKNASAGFRTDRLAEIIRAKYGVAKRKAAFLADQETSLLVSKYREQRYKALGFTEYVWATSHDEKVRTDHKLLDKTRHSWDSPPVTNRATGARNNPGEDFRCRCVAMPVIEFQE